MYRAIIKEIIKGQSLLQSILEREKQLSPSKATRWRMYGHSINGMDEGAR